MKPEQNNKQSDWLAETEEVVNTEAAQINGGSWGNFAEIMAMQEMQHMRRLQETTALVEAAADRKLETEGTKTSLQAAKDSIFRSN